MTISCCELSDTERWSSTLMAPEIHPGALKISDAQTSSQANSIRCSQVEQRHQEFVGFPRDSNMQLSLGTTEGCALLFVTQLNI